MPAPIITLTTDFGLNDHLVGTMKGVILSINPEAQICDITHNVAPYDILDAALSIGQSYRYYPAQTIHVVVVDPGVGTERRPILVSAGQHFFLAPDNGVLSLVYDREAAITAWHVTAEDYFLRPVSKTFHGRDIFSPAAAWLSRKWRPEAFGEQVTDYVRVSLPRPRVIDNVVKGEVLRADTFGNLLTNLTPEDVPQLLAAGARFRVLAGNHEVTRLSQTFTDAAPGDLFLILGSSGFFEISINKGNAAKTLGLGRGAEIQVIANGENKSKVQTEKGNRLRKKHKPSSRGRDF